MAQQYSDLSDSILSLLSSLAPTSPDALLVKVCGDLLAIFSQDPQAPRYFLVKHGVLPIMALLSISKNRPGLSNIEIPGVHGVSAAKPLPKVLQVVNKIIENNIEVQEHLSLVGMIPAVVKIAESIYVNVSARNAGRTGGLHLEAAKFVEQICGTSQLTLQMFIAGGGLPLLVKHLTLATDLQRSREVRRIVGVGIDGVLKVFELDTIRRIDFCHLFVNLGLLKWLTIGFRNLLAEVVERKEEKESSWDYLEKLVMITTIFAHSDPHVQQRMASENVLLGIINPLISMSLSSNNALSLPEDISRATDLILGLLKCVRNLMVDATTHNNLDMAQAIVTLMPLLESSSKGLFIGDLKMNTLECMFHLCRIDKTRQELAARNGLIRILQKCIKEENALTRKYAFPLLCEMAHASGRTREELWRCDGVEFYLGILGDGGSLVLNALTEWLSNDIDRVEPVLMLPRNIEKLASSFVGAGGGGGDSSSEHEIALLRILGQSTKLATILGQSKLFVSEVVERIKNGSAYSRKTCLSMLMRIIVGKEREIFMEYALFDLLNGLKDSEQIIVAEMAKELLGKLVVMFSPPNKKRVKGRGSFRGR